MKRFLLSFAFIFVLAVILCFSASAVETTFAESDSLEWVADVNLDDGTATITKINITKATKTVNIPSLIKYEGADYVVTKIGNNAFKDKNLLFGKVTFPETLKSIGSYAFYKTNIFSDVVIPESVTNIGEYAFAECRGLLSIKLPSVIKEIPANAFMNCFSLTTVTTDANIEKVGSHAFYRCYALHNISIGEGTKTIGSNAFYDCTGLDGEIDLSTVTSLASNSFQNCINLTSIKLPTINFELSTFSGCKKLTSYEVSSLSGHYTTIDGVLYNKNMSILYRYPAQKEGYEFVIPDTITEIYTDAFLNAEHIGKVIISKGITKIGSNAFRGTGLDYFYIPDTVTSIGTYVLADCPNLEWVVISKKLSSASNLVTNSSNVKLVIGRHDTFDTSSVGNAAVCKRANQYTCTDHIYGFLDDTATCTESGVNTCIICDRSSYVKPTGHEGAIVEKTELSCTTDAYIIVNCTKCGDANAKTIYEKSSGHVYTAKRHDPTDTSPGFSVGTCSVCKETIISDYVASFYLTGDINDDGKINGADFDLLASYLGGKSFVLNKLTCDINNDGDINLYDLILLKRFVEKIDSEIKSYTDGCKKHLHVSSLEASQSSCIDDGIEIFYCLDCGTIIDTKTTESLGHDWVKSTSIEASCSNSGFSSVRCSVCQTTTVLNFEKLPHTQSWWTMPGKKGYEYSECEVCGAFENRAVDYSEFDTLVAQIPKHYEIYYSEASLSLLKPILENYKLALTQEQVDKNVADFKAIMPRIQYAITDVPVVYINSTGNILLQNCSQNNNPYVNAEIAVAYYDENGEYYCYVEKNGEAKVRGNSTANKNKKPYNIRFSTNIDLLGLGEDNKYCLLANAIDPSLLRNALVRLFNDTCGLDYACKFEFVDVYCDGNYRGNYLMCTPADIEETRINIDKETDATIEILASLTEDNLLFQHNNYTSFFNMRLQISNSHDLNGEGYSNVYSTLCQLEYAVMSGDWEEIKKFADVDSLARFYILNDYMKDKDFTWGSTRFYIEDGKLHGGPAWDFDRALGHVNTNNGGTDDSNGGYYNRKEHATGVRGDSTTGEWASTYWIGYPTEKWGETFSNDDWVGSRNNHTWMTYMYHLIPEYKELISELMMDLKDEMTLIYADQKDSLGNVTTNAIDEIYMDDDIYASFVRNYTLWTTVPANPDEGWSFNSHREAIDQLRSWLSGRHQWMINYYAGDKLAEYCAKLADEELLNPNSNAYAKNTTTSLVKENDEYVYYVNVVISSEGLVGYLEEAIYNQAKRIFADNLSYTNVVVNLIKDDEIASAYSDTNVLNYTYDLVSKELAKLSNNKYAGSTSVVFEIIDGVITAKVSVNENPDDNEKKANQKAITDLIKRHFSNSNFYVSVDVQYYLNGVSTSHYSNGIAY